MHETLFDLNYQLCKEFPAMTPYDVEDKPFCRVIELYADVRRVQIKERKKIETPEKEKIIRRPASDNWF